jgi:segregation and condensation protein A
MLFAFRDVVQRAELFAHHHVQRERLSVRVRMADILSTLESTSFVEFAQLFRPAEGRMGVTVTFVAILELVREGLIDIVQTEAYSPLHVRRAGAHRGLRLVADNEDQLVPSDAPLVDASSADQSGLTIEAADADLGAADDEDEVADEFLEGVDEPATAVRDPDKASH